MFTGLITHVGTVDRVVATDAGREFRIASALGPLADGESIALNGVCLTVRSCDASGFTVAAVAGSLARTTLGDWVAGTRVNCERALRAGDALGGHFVQGHVDSTGEVTDVTNAGDMRLVTVELPAALVPLVAPQGSICLDGVSLTVYALPSEHAVQVALIEYTLRHSVLGEWSAGVRVNVEVDIIAKHVQRLLSAHGSTASLSS